MTMIDEVRTSSVEVALDSLVESVRTCGLLDQIAMSSINESGLRDRIRVVDGLHGYWHSMFYMSMNRVEDVCVSLHGTHRHPPCAVCISSRTETWIVRCHQCDALPYPVFLVLMDPTIEKLTWGDIPIGLNHTDLKTLHKFGTNDLVDVYSSEWEYTSLSDAQTLYAAWASVSLFDASTRESRWRGEKILQSLE